MSTHTPSWTAVQDALNRAFADALEQMAVALVHRPRDPALSLLAIDNARRRLGDFLDLYATALGGDCPAAWRKDTWSRWIERRDDLARRMYELLARRWAGRWETETEDEREDWRAVAEVVLAEDWRTIAEVALRRPVHKPPENTGAECR